MNMTTYRKENIAMKGVAELRLNHNGKYIILSQGSREYVETMLNWYQAHKEFFNGEFSVEYESPWKKIRIDYFDKKEQRWLVNAWTSDDDNEEGICIAKILLGATYETSIIEYLDEIAKIDDYAQNCIKEFCNNGP